MVNKVFSFVSFLDVEVHTGPLGCTKGSGSSYKSEWLLPNTEVGANCGHCLQVSNRCCCKPFLSGSQCLHYCWLAVLLTKANLHFGTGIDALYRIISSSSHSYSSTGHDCPCSWATGMRLCPLFCFGGKLNILWIRLTKHQSRWELMQSTLILGFCRVRYRSTTLLIALQSCQYWIKALKQLRHLNILSEGKKLFV